MKCIMVMVNDILFLYACSVVRTGCRGELEERRETGKLKREVGSVGSLKHRR